MRLELQGFAWVGVTLLLTSFTFLFKQKKHMYVTKTCKAKRVVIFYYIFVLINNILGESNIIVYIKMRLSFVIVGI